jgi:hypothetical protein
MISFRNGFCVSFNSLRRATLDAALLNILFHKAFYGRCGEYTTAKQWIKASNELGLEQPPITTDSSTENSQSKISEMNAASVSASAGGKLSVPMNRSTGDATMISALYASQRDDISVKRTRKKKQGISLKTKKSLNQIEDDITQILSFNVVQFQSNELKKKLSSKFLKLRLSKQKVFKVYYFFLSNKFRSIGEVSIERFYYSYVMLIWFIYDSISRLILEQMNIVHNVLLCLYPDTTYFGVGMISLDSTFFSILIP